MTEYNKSVDDYLIAIINKLNDLDENVRKLEQKLENNNSNVFCTDKSVLDCVPIPSAPHTEQKTELLNDDGLFDTLFFEGSAGLSSTKHDGRSAPNKFDKLYPELKDDILPTNIIPIASSIDLKFKKFTNNEHSPSCHKKKLNNSTKVFLCHCNTNKNETCLYRNRNLRVIMLNILVGR